MADTLAHSKFSTEMVDPKLRRDAWVEIMKPIYDISPVENGKLDFKASSEFWEVGGLFLGSIVHEAQITDHLRGKHNFFGDNDYICMLTYRQGGARSIHDGKPMHHRPNDVQLLDFSRDHRSVTKRSRVEGIWVPYETVGFDPGRHATNVTLRFDAPAGGLLSELSSMIFKELPTTDLKQAKSVAGMLTGILRNLVSDGLDKVANEQANFGRRALMQRFVIENTHDLSLNAQSLCREFGVSRATVFRDFEPGGLQHFMMLHRLDRALNDITRGPAIRGRIALIAEKWGFSSPAHFSRAFRENFGFSPSDAVGVAQGVGSMSALDIGGDYKWSRSTR